MAFCGLRWGGSIKSLRDFTATAVADPNAIRVWSRPQHKLTASSVKQTHPLRKLLTQAAERFAESDRGGNLNVPDKNIRLTRFVVSS